MRERLFKAKRIDNGEWVFGSLVYSADAEEEYKAIIIPGNANMYETFDKELGFEKWYKVDPGTISEYIGTTAKDGNGIWESFDELEAYRSIGTVEEFKALKEKSVAKKPRFYAHNYYCTECGNLVGNNEFEWQRFLYCDKCGQKLDWE